MFTLKLRQTKVVATECRILEEQFRILWVLPTSTAPATISISSCYCFLSFLRSLSRNAFSDDTVLNVCKLFAIYLSIKRNMNSSISLSSKVLITCKPLPPNNSSDCWAQHNFSNLKINQMRHCYLHFVFSNDSHWSLLFITENLAS